MSLDFNYFPLPYVQEGKRRNGILFTWPSVCMKCKSNECFKATDISLHLCSYGYNYQNIKPGLIIGGFLLRDWGQLTPARKKALHLNPSSIISRTNLNTIIKALELEVKQVDYEIEDLKIQELEKWVEKQQYKTEYLTEVKDKIIEGLSFIHDYKQINAEIGQNINVIIENNYEADSFEEKVEKATEQEKAIYYASKLLEDKLTVARLLVNPQVINDSSEYKKFKFHGMLLKYRRIYTSHIISKKIILDMKGASYQEIVAHPLAFSVIPHTFLDNAIKYSQKGSRILIEVHDRDECIDFSVSSYGPRILPEETKQIFRPFFRGKEAQKQEEEGAGYGLYVSQLVATQHLGSEIKVTQESSPNPNYGYWTTFSLEIPLKAK